MPFLRLLTSLLVAALLAGCVQGPGDGGDDDGPGDGDGGDGGDVPRTVAWGDVASATIRPGASLGGYCTYNFLFTGSNGTAYIGTAGHCTGELGERVLLGADGPEIGTVVFDSDVSDGADRGLDFALIRLDDAQVASAHPRMFGPDGPKGFVAAGEAKPGDRVAIYGYGMVFGDQQETRPREGVLVSEDGREYRADMPAVFGDSGSPLLHVPSGKALGIISRFGIYDTPPTTDIGPMIPWIQEELVKAGFDVTLATV